MIIFAFKKVERAITFLGVVDSSPILLQLIEFNYEKNGQKNYVVYLNK